MGSSHLNLNILPKETLRALNFLSDQRWLKKSDWYLAGGTALALSAGHRQSVDLDFFTQQPSFLPGSLLNHFKNKKWKTDISEIGTVYGTLLGAKISFISYPFFRYVEEPLWYGNIRVLKPQDIAVMKIVAISQRGRKRDFVDLYWYAQNCESLILVIKKLRRQYPTVAHNYHHILESLMYFEDAEADPMPKIYFKADWQGIRSYFRRVVPSITKELLSL